LRERGTRSFQVAPSSRDFAESVPRDRRVRRPVIRLLLQRKGLASRVTTDEDIEAAVNTPPQTTRAKLRGEFISAAQEAGRDFTVDWVHLKLNDQAQRTVLCKDPFRSVDERVKRLIASM